MTNPDRPEKVNETTQTIMEALVEIVTLQERVIQNYAGKVLPLNVAAGCSAKLLVAVHKIGPDIVNHAITLGHNLEAASDSLGQVNQAFAKLAALGK